MKTRRLALTVGVMAILALAMSAADSAFAAPSDAEGGTTDAEFVFGFKTLADLIPDVVGLPVESEQHAANGDALQKTTRGLLMWRKADNFTAFSDGSTTWTSGATGLQKSSNAQTLLNVSVGTPPAAGWTWAVMTRNNGSHEVLEMLDSHGFPWGFFVIRGSVEIGGPSGSSTINAGEATLIPTRQSHSHHYAPRSLLLGFRLGSAASPPDEHHGGVPVFLSKRLETAAGVNYMARVRQFLLAPGERLAENAVVNPNNFVFVIEGTLTSRSSTNTVAPVEAGKADTLPSNADQLIANEGSSLLRFVLVDLHP